MNKPTTEDYLSVEIVQAHESAARVIHQLQTDCWKRYEQYCEENEQQLEKLKSQEISPADFKRWRLAELGKFGAFRDLVREVVG